MRNCIVRELQAITPIRGKDLVTVTRYLQGKQLKSLSQINLQMLEEYHGFIAAEYEGKSERGHYGALLETTVLYHLSPAFQNLICEIDEKSKLSRAESNKLKMFLMVAKIHMLREITFETRKKFDAYLRKTGFINKNEYLKALDRLKLASIREENERNPNIVPKLYYASREIYLGYHPDYRIAMEFYYIRDKEELVARIGPHHAQPGKLAALAAFQLRAQAAQAPAQLHTGLVERHAQFPAHPVEQEPAVRERHFRFVERHLAIRRMDRGLPVGIAGRHHLRREHAQVWNLHPVVLHDQVLDAF